MRIDFPDTAPIRQQVNIILAQHGITGVPLDAPTRMSLPSILPPVADGYTALLVLDDAPEEMLAALEQVPGVMLVAQ